MRKIDTNPLLPFTYVDLMRIICPVDKKKALGVVGSNSKGEMRRRVSARSTPNCHSSAPALDKGRGCAVDMRELKGLEIAARCKITFKNGAWLVPSQSGNGTYCVVLAPQGDRCSCDDFSLTGEACKHVHAARLVRERDHGGKTPVVVNDDVPKRKTYKQDWPLYDRAQMTEKRRFLALLHDLCRGVEEPPQPKTGRPRTPMADMVFAVALKVYTTFSSRRFACDLEDACAKGYLSHLMHSVSVCAYLDSELMTPVLKKLIVRSSLPLATVETVFAPDSSGFSTSRFVRWYDEKYGVTRSGKEWVKAHVMTGVKTNIISAVEILDKNAADCPQFKPLVEKTAENFAVKEVVADKAYLSNDNLALVEGMGGTAYIPFKINSSEGGACSVWEKMFHYFQFRREEFLKHYHQRSNVESTFSMVKAKFRDHVRSKTDTAMKNECLAKLLCHNICVVHQSHIELGIEPVFWGNEPSGTDEPPAVLPLVRTG
jgi:transposase